MSPLIPPGFPAFTPPELPEEAGRADDAVAGVAPPPAPAPGAAPMPAPRDVLVDAVRAMHGAEWANRLRAVMPADGPVREALAAAYASPNLKRAILAAERIAATSSTMPAEHRAALIHGAAAPRSFGLNGREGVLSPLQAANAACAWEALRPAERDTISGLLARAGCRGAAPVAGADPMAERALILKALGARGEALRSTDARVRDRALAELRAFAEAIRGLPRAVLMQQTSLLDIDETWDSSGFDPLSLEDRPGAPAERPVGASQADNDGLYQRYEETCGPTSMEVLLGEADPVYAFRRRTGRFDLAPAPADDLQAQVIAEFDLDPGSRVAVKNIVDFKSAVARLAREGRLTDEQARELNRYVLGTPSTPKSAGTDRALAALRAATGGFPDDAQVEAIRAYVPPDPEAEWGRIGFANVEKLLDRYIGKRLGVDYELHSLYGEAYRALPREEAARRSSQFVLANLDRLAKNLEQGVDVVVGTSWPDHFWSMSAVDGPRGDRRFLVHDPWSGRTKWIPEREIVDGSFARQFMGESKTRTYVDMLYMT